MAKKYRDITLALAGICQATYLVQRLAYYGQCNIDALHISLNSLFDLNPPSILDIFGNHESNLHCGLEILIGLLNNQSYQRLGSEITKYAMSIMILERKLYKTQEALISLSSRIDEVNKQRINSAISLDQIFSLIAEMYIDIISPLRPRIQVIGSVEVLKNVQIQNKIRTMLLAGIRSAVLWQQIGGRRWQLICLRKHIICESQQILKF
ncbi:high frequency lysogenization protein HflD [Candidatus Erwinia haradaeae]|uniref:High frequency lysogenization protein HflD homolog n=1 Tax=Candidatus Erwinia haradaeae TaxID=1922217 RepID=A0A451D3M1_9GAMM|nr:high frequency lysogenization protein HflD [Candidatus Erwinia haradaeae]VFP80270.1 High frequency lysogenization protein HflD [Candidatus Erwinia haradaeae]